MFKTFLKSLDMESTISNIRFNTTLITLTVVISVLYATFTGNIITDVYVWLAAIALGGKVAQKFAEKKEDKSV